MNTNISRNDVMTYVKNQSIENIKNDLKKIHSTELQYIDSLKLYFVLSVCTLEIKKRKYSPSFGDDLGYVPDGWIEMEFPVEYEIWKKLNN